MADAFVGLWKACLKFDKEHGIPFRSYAGKVIRWEIADGSRQRDLLTRDTRARVKAGETDWFEDGKHIFAPSFSHFEDSVGRDSEGGSIKLADVISDESIPPVDQIISDEEVHQLHEALADLPERERLVLIRIFVEEQDGVELAQELGITGGRVSQIKSQALKNAKNYLEEKKAA